LVKESPQNSKIIKINMENKNSQRVLDVLDYAASTYPRRVVKYLNKGDLIGTSPVSQEKQYLIDDVQIDKQIADVPQGKIAYSEFYRQLEPSLIKQFRLFEGRKIVPFSEAIRERIGVCLEKSITAQLACQRTTTSFLISGIYSETGSPVDELHAFNIVFFREKPYLMDVQNPLSINWDQTVNRPYLAPLEDIQQDGKFILQENWRMGREYSLF
jgi:hypothetical protein